MFTPPLSNMLRFTLAISLLAETVMSSCKPDFGVPPGAAASISVIDAGIKFAGLEAEHLLRPVVEEFDVLPTLPSWSFLIESSKGEKVLFDLGIPPDFRKSYAPATWKRLESETNWTITVENHVADVLKNHGQDLSEIKSVIWSHYHWDHIGDIRTFPRSTEIVVGPGFKDIYLPAWPTNPDSTLREDYFTGRTLREVNFTAEATPIFAGVQRAFDFFGDGSFFLVHTPGHTLEHLGGLVRTTTNPDTFIFLGGDLLHHGSELRPSPYLPYPDHLPHVVQKAIKSRVHGCPGHGHGLFPDLNTHYNRSKTEPLFDPNVAVDVGLAIKTIKEVQMADVQDDVFFIWAHDTGIKGLVDEFPKKANDWKARGWREKLLWAFLEDLVPAAVAVSEG